MKLKNLSNEITLPFVTGYAEQQYLIAEQGILSAKQQHCDYWYIDGSMESEMPHNWNQRRIDALLKSIAAYHVKPIFHGNFKSPLASDVEEIRVAAVSYTRKEIDLAERLDAPLIIHGGVVVEPRLIRTIKQKAIENYLRSVSELFDYAVQKGVDIYLENLCNYKNYRPFHYIFTHFEEIEYVFARLNGVYLYLDVGHANVCDGDPVELIQRYHNRIIGMSFSNNDGERDQHFGLCKGTINYEGIVKAIIDSNWHGIVGFETRGKTTLESIGDLNSIYQRGNSTGRGAVTMNNSLVGILGGMGPLASSAFVNFLYQKCRARFVQEQSYPRIILLSDPTIPDRMDSVNHGERFKELVDILEHHIEKLLSVGARQILLCCFTAHYFLPSLSFESQKAIVNLTELLTLHLNVLAKPTLILGSELLTRSQLIASAYAVYPEQIYFAKIHQLIYNIKLNGALPVYQQELILLAQSLARRYGVGQVLFACTEFHLIYQQLEEKLLDILDGLNIAADFILNCNCSPREALRNTGLPRASRSQSRQNGGEQLP